MLALSEICLGCLRLLGQAVTLLVALLVTALLAISTGDVRCALLRRFFGVFRLARLSIAITPI